MAINLEKFEKLSALCKAKNATLVAVSKTKPIEDIQEFYDKGQRDFGENYVQELVEKEEQLPKDIRWHFIGHLQSNKVKYIAAFVHLIHGVDSLKLLKEINKQGKKIDRKISCLLQVHIAKEETKFGFDADEIATIDIALYPFVEIKGLMGMASYTEDNNLIMQEFNFLHHTYKQLKEKSQKIDTLSMGMSSDYEFALDNGSTMLRIGSILFGARQKR